MGKGVDVHLAHVVEQVEIEVFHPAPAQLLLKDLFRLPHVVQVISREFVRQEKLLPGIPGQGLPQRGFGMAVMVAPRGVVVIDTAGHGLVHHAADGFLIHPAVVSADHGQAHRAHAQVGKPDILVLTVNHGISPFRGVQSMDRVIVTSPLPSSVFISSGVLSVICPRRVYAQELLP